MLIEISENILVNPKLISSIEIKDGKLLIHVGNKTHTSTLPPKELLAKLRNIDMDNSQFVRM